MQTLFWYIDRFKLKIGEEEFRQNLNNTEFL